MRMAFCLWYNKFCFYPSYSEKHALNHQSNKLDLQEISLSGELFIFIRELPELQDTFRVVCLFETTF